MKCQKVRILQKIESINNQISNLKNKLNNKAYVKNAPKDIVNNEFWIDLRFRLKKPDIKRIKGKRI